MALLMAGKTTWILLDMFISVTLNVGLNLVLIPRMGITGAAVAWAVSIVVTNVATVVQVHMLMRIRLFGQSHTRAVALAALCYGGLGIVVRILLGATIVSLVAAVAVGTLVYLPLLYSSRHVLQLSTLRDALRLRRAGQADAAPFATV